MTVVLLTGAAGQLGRDLLRTDWAEGTELVPRDRADLDVADADAVARDLDAIGPEVIVNAAAYTNVDGAESEPELAHAVNADGVGNLARWADANDARLVHISTDYVFDGTKDGWYVESDPIAPLGAYGRSKAAGEEQARLAARHLILRTAWVYGAHGHNFVRTMLRLGAERDELNVVADQRGCPSATADLAAAIATLVHQSRATEASGTYHLASPTEASWHEFASAILAPHIADGLQVHPITTDQYPTPAARPANSRLDSSALAAATGVRLRPWTDALTEVLAELATASDTGDLK